MYNTFDLLGIMETPGTYLCQADKEFMGRIVVKDLSLNEKWNDYSDISFDVPFKLIDFITGNTFVNPYYDKVESMRVIFVEGIGFFQIQNVEVQSDGVKEYKSITAHSYEVVFGQKYLNHFKVNTGDTDSLEYEENPEDIEPIRIYYPGKISHSLLDIVLEKLPDWKVGHVDNEFTTVSTEGKPGMNRMFDIDRMSVYDFLMSEVAPTIHGVFVFDTIENTINLYSEERAGQDTDIFISKDNLLKEVRVEYDSNDIKTSLKVSGQGEEVNIRIHNFGSDYITDLSHYATPEYMGEDLYQSYTAYIASLPEKQQSYTSLASQYSVLSNEFTVLQAELAELKGKEQSYSNIQQSQLEAGWAQKPAGSKEYLQYKNNFDKLNEVKQQMISKQSDMDSKESAIREKAAEMNTITDSIKYENNFTPSQLVKLNLFLREDEYSDSCFAFTDNDTIEDKTETEKELYEAAKKELFRISRPQLSFDLSMANIYALQIYEKISKYFSVGNYVTVGIRDDYFVHARIVEISLNYDDPANFSVKFGNIYKSKSTVDIHSELIKQTSSISNKVANSSSFWQKSAQVANDTMQIIKDGLGTAVEQIKMSDNQDVTYDRYGLHLRKKADKNASQADVTVDGYHKKQAWITNEKFMYTSDGWETSKSAFGSFTYNGQEIYGLIADMVLAGFIQGSEITGSKITGTEINNGNKTFYVTPNGALTAASADIKGKISATSGYIGNGSGGFTISPTSIYNGLSSLNGSSDGVYIGADGISCGGGKFKVTKNGQLNATSVNLSGSVTAASGSIGGFTISATKLHRKSNAFGVGMSSSASEYAFWAGETNNAYGSAGTNAIFKVGNNGKLWASEANISGVINATSGSFTGEINATSGVFNDITVGNSTWNNGSIFSPTINTPSISDGTYSLGSLSRCCIPNALYMGSGGGTQYIEPGNPGGVIITAPTGGIILKASNTQGAGVLIQNGDLAVLKDASVFGQLFVHGSKTRAVETKSYGTLSLNAYETPFPTFADYGKAEIDETGKCYISIDPRFAEVIDISVECTVFLTKYGEGDIWVNEKENTNDVISIVGTPGMRFSWEIRYAQAGVDLERMKKVERNELSADYEELSNEYLKEYGRRIG